MELYGQDAIRLADCINFAAKNNIAIEEDTQSGVNQNSGNVWLWSEEWSYSIFQDIGFNGPWLMWSCPECGEEFKFDTLGEVEVEQKHFDDEGHCKSCVERRGSND